MNINTVKAVHSGGCIKRSPCILRSLDNFPKFSVALNIFCKVDLYIAVTLYITGDKNVVPGYFHRKIEEK